MFCPWLKRGKRKKKKTFFFALKFFPNTALFVLHELVIYVIRTVIYPLKGLHLAKRDNGPHEDNCTEGRGRERQREKRALQEREGERRRIYRERERRQELKGKRAQEDSHHEESYDARSVARRRRIG